jgi:hypothetical protein
MRAYQSYFIEGNDYMYAGAEQIVKIILALVAV